MEDLFKYRSYRDYLRKMFPQSGEKRGQRQALAKALHCQTSLISLVVTDRSHLNEDMAYQVTQFLNLNKAESDFFLILFHFERAGTPALRSHYKERIEAIIKSRSEVKTRVEAKTEIPFEVQATYYSEWYYAAVHTLILNPKFRNREALAVKLELTPEKVEEVISFLLEWGFAKREKGNLLPGVIRLHLGKDSPFISQHHRNWHLEALRKVNGTEKENVHYSGILSMSKKDAQIIKELLLNSISQIEKQIQPSPDEDVAGLVIDFFRY